MYVVFVVVLFFWQALIVLQLLDDETVHDNILMIFVVFINSESFIYVSNQFHFLL